MTNTFDSAGIFLIQTVFDFFIFVALMRLLLQFFHANYYNPIVAFILKITNPAVKPLRKFVPGFGGIDFSIVVLVLILEFIKLFLMAWLNFSAIPNVLGVSIWALGVFLKQLINVFFYATIIQVVMSWFPQFHTSPIYELLLTITEPIMRPVRRIIPAIAGIDLSPLFVIIGLKLIGIILTTPIINLGMLAIMKQS